MHVIRHAEPKVLVPRAHIEVLVNQQWPLQIVEYLGLLLRQIDRRRLGEQRVLLLMR